MEKKITPTVTLAQLYEAQKQYFDAFTIYNILYRNNPTDDILTRKNAIEKKIFNDSNLEYNPLIDKIFSIEDKERFKILPATNFQTLKQAIENDNFEIIVFEPDEFTEPPEDDYENEHLVEEYTNKNVTITSDLIDANQTSHVQHTPKSKLHRTNEKTKSNDDKNLMNLTISEFSKYIIKHINKDKKISELTLKEIKDIKQILSELL